MFNLFVWNCYLILFTVFSSSFSNGTLIFCYQVFQLVAAVQAAVSKGERGKGRERRNEGNVQCWSSLKLCGEPWTSWTDVFLHTHPRRLHENNIVLPEDWHQQGRKNTLQTCSRMEKASLLEKAPEPRAGNRALSSQSSWTKQWYSLRCKTLR